ncbi:glycosyltransferase family 4 protein [Cyanobacterium stanieri LEGE 03274]|uniref:Glycosyltransferase family 4 protein n=1 Tax=Cyanobacterium stanieri LEGE 03274 TaxID=1828756 RepID=A0ABR9V0M8_9CHRO|nr:glycosyltransferase family 4 protein [Cyanobacterium stanieri]MBE9221441.1 glycosyltransferase family 4 protein [Cyanobacterium stanieri LEGE 03274]
MRIAYICADAGIPVFGEKGCSIHVQEIIRCFIKKGAKISLFTPRLGGEIPQEFKDNIDIYLLPPIPKGELELREKKAISINHTLYQLLEQNHPFDLIYERYSLWSYQGIEYGYKHNIPTILEVNSPLIDEQEKHRGLFHKIEAENIAHKVFNLTNHIVAVSEEIKSYLKSYLANTEKIKVISNGVNPERFSDVSRNLKKDIFTIGFVGTLKPWHGLNILLDAFNNFYKKYPQGRLLIVGDGTQKEKLIQDISNKKLEAVVTLTGKVSPNKIPLLLSQMDVGVAPYPALKNFYFSPLKVYEYMAASLPVIASDIGQLKTIISHDKNGFLVPAGDINALIYYLEQLFNNPLLAQKMGQNGHSYVINNHTWIQVTDSILNLIK